MISFLIKRMDIGQVILQADQHLKALLEKQEDISRLLKTLFQNSK